MSKFVNINGVKISYSIRGSGVPLILLMGFGAGGELWEKHVQEYEKHFTCFIIDNRGVASSDQPSGSYTTLMMAHDMVAVMDQEKIDKASVAGISMGGAIAQELVLNYPERVKNLMLISTWAKFNKYTTAIYQNLKRLRETAKPQDFVALIQLWIFAPPYYENETESLVKGQKQASNNPNLQTTSGFNGQLDACISHNTIARLKQIKVPTLITVGEMDIFTPLSYSKILHDAISGSKLIAFKNGGHAHHWEELDLFNKETTNFLLNI